MQEKRCCVIIIPALDPDDNLVKYVEALVQEGFRRIIIVNDGSTKEKEAIFEQLTTFPNSEITVLQHVINCGKGRALKNAFNFFLQRYSDDSEIIGAITVDSDGQHAISDVINLEHYMKNTASKCGLVLGVRDFNQPDVPPKSKWGNKMTSKLFHLLYGVKISDTQTGLRGFPKANIKNFLTLSGERFEYETHMLICCVQKKIKITELKIQTLYFSNNNGTHFQPIRDSWCIYRLLLASFLKYCYSSISSAFIDLGVFQIFYLFFREFKAINAIWVATACARIISSLYNYCINRTFVFKSAVRIHRSLLRYYSLCVVQLICSAAFVSLVHLCIVQLPVVLIKILVDTILFLISYKVQQKYVFANTQNNREDQL